MRKTIGLWTLLAALFLRFATDEWPSLLVCSLFWCCAIVNVILLYNYWAVPGMLCNAAATLANGGVMPVYGQEVKDPGFHVAGTPDMALQFLCDRYAGFSIGDFLLLAGLVAVFALKLCFRPQMQTQPS